jgi:hypothetical protein
LLGTRALRQWYADALSETLRDRSHDDEAVAIGQILEDRRAR